MALSANHTPKYNLHLPIRIERSATYTVQFVSRSIYVQKFKRVMNCIQRTNCLISYDSYFLLNWDDIHAQNNLGGLGEYIPSQYLILVNLVN